MNPASLLHASIALLPVLLFLAALLYFDSFKLLRFRTVLTVVAVGAVAAAASYPLNTIAYARFPGEFESYTRYVSPWIEELLKAVPLVFLIRTRRVGLQVDAAIVGFAVGTGFALVENLYYLASRPEATLAVQVIRGFGTAIMHGGTATILAMISVTLYEKRPDAGLLVFVPGYLAAVLLHSGFNQLLVRPALATLVILLLLRESGIEELPIDARTRDSLAELAALERAIGATGMLALRPLIMASSKDVWQLRLLGR